jgi:hypothetical protein
MEKHDCIVIEVARPITKEQLLEVIKKELDKDVVRDMLQRDFSLNLHVNRHRPQPHPPERPESPE